MKTRKIQSYGISSLVLHLQGIAGNAFAAILRNPCLQPSLPVKLFQLVNFEGSRNNW